MINNINSSEKATPEEDALPQTFGVSDRWMYKQNIDRGAATALDQTLGVKTVLPPSNPNDYIYARTAEFPQPSIIGSGVITAAGAVDTNRFFFSQNWTITPPATLGAGIYQIKHNIGDSKYAVQLTPVATTVFTANLAAFNNNYFEVRTFNGAGAATNCSFTFTVWIIP